jgi:hypothetical protein
MTNAQPAVSKILLDPLFKPPIGSEENFTIVYPAPGRQTVQEGIDPNFLPGANQTGLGDDQSQFFLPSPEGIVIIDQRLRRAPGGQQVVDIIVQCSDVLGALEYEIQIAKV